VRCQQTSTLSPPAPCDTRHMRVQAIQRHHRLQPQQRSTQSVARMTHMAAARVRYCEDVHATSDRHRKKPKAVDNRRRHRLVGTPSTRTPLEVVQRTGFERNKREFEPRGLCFVFGPMNQHGPHLHNACK
jgi:hypothetical protein